MEFTLRWQAKDFDMTEPTRPTDSAAEPSLAREMEAIPVEPLLPIEKKLIAGSLLLGLVLLGILLWLSQRWFPP
jgi:hypothetical protein